MTHGSRPRIPMADFDYDLPSELIAQHPLQDRGASRLLVIDRTTGEVAHESFSHFPAFLDPGDLIVVNNSRVIPARLIGHRMSGGEVEFLLLRNLEGTRWEALIRPIKRLHAGEIVVFPSRTPAAIPPAAAVLLEKRDHGLGVVELDERLSDDLGTFGRVPLPPYIRQRLEDDDRYQTVYANDPGSAAAPTAGLHFTQEMFDRLTKRGIRRADVTLHVGLDTFRPVTSDFAEDHQIHSEWCSVPEQTANAIIETRQRGNRVVAIGTTSARTLETWGMYVDEGRSGGFSGPTSIYITPGYEWTVVDAMVTNFHLPRSTLLLMISAFAGTDQILAAYRQAVARKYRFFSFGDAMLLINRSAET